MSKYDEQETIEERRWNIVVGVLNNMRGKRDIRELRKNFKELNIPIEVMRQVERAHAAARTSCVEGGKAQNMLSPYKLKPKD